MHYTAVSKRCTADKSCSHAVCRTDFPVKNKWGNVSTVGFVLFALQWMNESSWVDSLQTDCLFHSSLIVSVVCSAEVCCFLIWKTERRQRKRDCLNIVSLLSEMQSICISEDEKFTRNINWFSFGLLSVSNTYLGHHSFFHTARGRIKRTQNTLES